MSNFASFQQAFKGDLVTSEHPEYSQAIARAAVNQQKNAKVVAFIKDANDASLAIQYAKESKLPLAIRCGGLIDTSSSDGLVIDLSRHLNTVRIDAEKKLAYVGGGTLWSAVDKAAIAHGLATVGATAGHVGVGGFLLTGCYGWLTGEHGLGTDNIVQVTVVTADGSVVTASDNENSDLFWGIRGGGSNFGVVTEFVLKLHPQRRTVFGGVIIFSRDALDKVATATQKWWGNGRSEKAGLVQFWTIGPDGSPCIVVAVFYNGSEAEGRAAYKEFFEAGPIRDATREMPYEEVNAIPYASSPGGFQYIRGAYNRKSDLETIRKVFDKVVEYKAEDFRTAVMFDYIPLHNAKHSINPTSLIPSSGALMWLTWDDKTPNKTEIAASHASELFTIISKEGKDHFVIDEPSIALEKNSQIFFGRGYSRLQDLKKKYDPEQVFNKWYPIKPAA